MVKLTEISLIDSNDMLIEAQLSDSVYYIGMSWNEEAQQWVMSLRDLNQEVLISGIAVVPNWPMLYQIRRPDFPPGELIAFTPKFTEIKRRTFMEGKAFLFYIENDNAAI